MEKRLHIIPNGRVRDLSGHVVPEKGATVRMNTYWRRRIKDGDVSIVSPSPSKQTKNNNQQIIKSEFNQNLKEIKT